MSIKLTCPHGRPMKANKSLGLIYYTHKSDDSDCSVMNKFSSSTERALSAMVNVRKANIDDVLVQVACRNSTPARFRFYKSLSDVKGRELARRLAVFDIKVCGNSQRTKLRVGKELAEAFGRNGLEAYEQATGFRFPFSADERKKSRKPKFKIQNLKTEAIVGSVDTIRRELLAQEQRKLKALGDLPKSNSDVEGGLWSDEEEYDSDEE